MAVEALEGLEYADVPSRQSGQGQSATGLKNLARMFGLGRETNQAERKATLPEPVRIKANFKNLGVLLATPWAKAHHLQISRVRASQRTSLV